MEGVTGHRSLVVPVTDPKLINGLGTSGAERDLIGPVTVQIFTIYRIHTLWLDQNVARDHDTLHMHLWQLNKKPHSSVSSAQVEKQFVALESA